jgi:hypothetical protein
MMCSNKKLFKCILIVIIGMTCVWNFSIAQNHYTISVPSQDYSLKANKLGTDPDVLVLVNEIAKYKNLATSIDCVKKMNLIMEDSIRNQMKKITVETPYILAVNWNSCQFISLRKDNDKDNRYGSYEDKSTTYYRINLYPIIPTEPVIKPDDPSTYSSSLLATYLTNEGQWVAMGPFLVSDPYSTEDQAIGSLSFTPSEYKFISKQGNYKIYTLNKQPHLPLLDVRFLLKQVGITNLPK